MVQVLKPELWREPSFLDLGSGNRSHLKEGKKKKLVRELLSESFNLSL